jgi:nitrate/nitrite transport system ATP-binding protein
MPNPETPNPKSENMQTLNSQKTTKSVSDTTSAGTPFLSIKDVSKVYPTAKGPAVILDGVNLQINEGEFICLIGHSGCGKSTLLNMIAGFNGPTDGEVALQGVRITEPGPDRMVVFQNYSLLPWLTATENIHLGVETVYAEKSAEEHNKIVQQHLELVGLTEACEKRPGQLSGGMKQRVAIARALATRPKLLILDEPFGALDPITREELQEELLKIWQEYKITVIMITHDIDEALFLSDRIVMMTNGPAASIGEDVHIPFSRPRNRTRIMEDPKYYELRNFALEFLFSRYAHTDGDEETETALPPLPESAFRLAPVPGTPRTNLPPAEFVPHASGPSEASRLKGAVLGVSWLFAMSVLAAVNMSSVASQQKLKSAEAAPIAPAAVISSPPTPAAPTAAATTAAPTAAATTAAATTATTAAPTAAATTAPTAAATTAPTAAATTAPTAAATTAPTAAATTAPTAAATTATTAAPTAAATTAPTAAKTTAPTAAATTAPTAAATTAPIPKTAPTAAAKTAPTAATTSATSQIADKAELDAIGQKLYAQIDQNWSTTPTFTESLTYRVKVKQNGDIVQFEPTNKAAKDFLKETPLPVLQTPVGAPAGAEKTAEFQVTFSPSNGGKLEVKSGK